MRARRKMKRLARGIVAAVFVLLAARMMLLAAVTPQPPPLHGDARLVRTAEPASWVRKHDGILQVHLQGTPEQIGAAHARLLRAEMEQNETALWGVFASVVPTAVLRGVITDLARVRFANLDDSLGYARRAELAAAASAFRPDPFEHHMPTYSRFLMLNALYDVSLSFEHSPLIGCSSVYVADGMEGPLLGRNFDFEAHEVFDRGKAVIVFAENGQIPVLSVAWPGLSGVVTGMNAKGVGAVVHGARAGSPSSRGQPVLLTLREALANSETAEQAAAWLAKRPPIVSHMVLVGDASGQSFVVERVPDRDGFIRRGATRVALTNHLEGPSASDPANQRVREVTSTLPRRKRLNVLLSGPDALDTRDIIAILRDRRDEQGRAYPYGDRRAIDADIATHGVVMNLRQRVLWVSQGPHLAGRFVKFDLARWLPEPEAGRIGSGIP